MGILTISTIVVLLFGSSPSAISWLVISIVVWIAIYGVFESRFFPHMFKEFCKRFSPFRTNGYPAPSIILPSRMLRISAALNHVRPASIFWPSIFSESASMLKIPLFLEASTTFRGTCWILAHYKFNTNHFLISAITSAKPEGAAHFINPSQSSESVEFFPSNIFECVHMWRLS